MDLDPESETLIPKCEDGVVHLKVLKLPSDYQLQSNPEADDLTFDSRHITSNIIDTVKSKAKIHFKSVSSSVVGFLSGAVSEFTKERKKRPSVSAMAQIKKLHQWCETQIDMNTHNNLFKRLWKVLVSDASFQHSSTRWIDVGFQNESPVTDFRGGGTLCVCVCVCDVEYIL